MPVRPGDVLSCRYTVEEKRDLASRPDVGISKVLVELIDQKGEMLANWRTNQLTRRRNPGRRAGRHGREARAQGDRKPLGCARRGEPAAPRCFFEDRQIGEMTDFGRHTFGKDEIIAFAREFDPQPFHLDEAAAKASLFGALVRFGLAHGGPSSAATSARA